jgi:hypothetical protein
MQMTPTPYCAKDFAHDLPSRTTRRMESLSMATLDLAVDPSPHQIEAAWFALQSPRLIEEDFRLLMFEMEGACWPHAGWS